MSSSTGRQVGLQRLPVRQAGVERRKVHKAIDTSAVLDAMLKMEKALVEKNKDILEGLLHKDVAFGHSSGWVQTKKDVMKDMKSGFLVYNKIENNSIAIEAGKEKSNSEREDSGYRKRDSKDFDLTSICDAGMGEDEKGMAIVCETEYKIVK